MAASAWRRPWQLLASVLLAACAQHGDAKEVATVRAAPRAESKPDGTLLHLEGRSGSADALWGEASFRLKRKGGKLVRQLELDVGNAAPGVAQVLTLDGCELGSVAANRKGSLELDISEEDKELFPPGFHDPKVGSVFRVGELMELQLDKLEKLTDLEAVVTGPGALSGKVNFKVERLSGVVTREFQVKLEKAPQKSLQPVTLDGVHVGDVNIDVEGTGKLKFSSKLSPPFPDGFPEPHVGSRVQVGELFSGALVDGLVGLVE